MTSVLLVLLALAVLGASLALLAISLAWAGLANVLALAATVCGLASFVLMGIVTVRRAQRIGRAARP